jgi:hypothetical protein
VRSLVFTVLAGSLLLGLGACRKHEKASTQLGGNPAATAQDPMKVTPDAFPSGWPDFLPAYPGGQIVEGREGENNGMPMLTAIQQTSDEAEKVIAFYGRQVIGKDFAVVSSSQVANEAVAVYRRENQSLSITARRGKDNSTRIELTLAGSYEPPVQQDDEKPSDTDEKKDDKPAKDKSSADADSNPLMPRYPGATAERPVPDGQKVQVRMRTPDSKEQVMDFYEKVYAGKGFRSTGRFNLDTQLSATFQGAEGTAIINVGNAAMGNAAHEQPTLIFLIFDSTPPAQ